MVGLKAMENFKEKNYHNEFEPIELDLEKWCLALIPYITGKARKNLESENWFIDRI